MVSGADTMSSENSHFEEKSGIVFSSTEWGRWYQTGNEVMVEVDVEYGTRAKDVIVDIKPSKLTCLVRGNKMFEVHNVTSKSLISDYSYILEQGQPFDIVVEDESTWTLEDKQLLRIQLVKANPRKDQCWLSLLKDQFYADAKTLNEMRKKLDLEQFQLEVCLRGIIAMSQSCLNICLYCRILDSTSATPSWTRTTMTSTPNGCKSRWTRPKKRQPSSPINRKRHLLL